MVSKKAKGHKAENEMARIFIDRGYVVQVAQRTSVFTGKFYVSKDNDFFNLFDILAIDKYRIIFCQVKSNATHCYGAMKEISKFKTEVGNSNIIYHVSLRVSRKGWVVWYLQPDGNEWVKTFFNLKGILTEPFTYT